MAAAPEEINACCAEWKKKYMKNETSRKHLREAVKILQQRLEELEAQNASLKKEDEELRVLADTVKEERAKESAARVSLENEISELKCEIVSLKQIGSADAQGQVSELEEEISCLKDLIEREKKRVESESKKATAEKKKAAEALKSLKIEKSNADEEKKRAEMEREKAENYKLQLEKLKEEADEELRVLADTVKEERAKESAARVSLENEISELKSEIVSLKQIGSADAQGQVSELEEEISCLKDLIEREKKKVESESKKATAEKKKAAEALKSLKIEKSNADEEKKRAEMEREKAENYKLQLEKLKEEADEELRVLADTVKEERAKESAARVSLENEISELKSEIVSLKQIGSADAQGQVSELEEEISCLKDLIEREKKRVESESKKATAEKKKAAEALKSLKIEKSNADEEKKRAEMEREKAENYKLQLEKLKEEADEEKSNLPSETAKLDGEKEICRLKDVIEREKKRAESESKKAEAEKKKLAEAKKNLKIEKAKADEERKHTVIEREKTENYRLQLEVFKMEADKVKSDLASETAKLEVANKKLEAEKQNVVKERERANSAMAKAEEQRKLAEANSKKNTEEKCHAESLSLQLKQSRKRVDELQKQLEEVSSATDNINDAIASKEIPSLEEANKRYEAERDKAIKEKKRADSEMLKTEKKKTLSEVNLKKAMEEKSRADHLSLQLDEAKRKIQDLSTKNLFEVSGVQQLAKGTCAESTKVKLLKKQLKFEKMQRKHAEEVVKVKLERNLNSILQQELGRLKLDFDHMSQRLDMLNNSFSCSVEGIDDHVKTGNIMQEQRLKSLQMNLQSRTDFIKPGFRIFDASDPFKEATQQTGPYPPLSGGNCTGSISGIDSKLESPRGSERNTLQSSAINSSTASFSDGQLVGSQGKGDIAITMPGKMIEENVQPTISNLSSEAVRECNNAIAVVAENCVKSPLLTKGVERVNEQSRMRKRRMNTVKSIENLYCEGQKFHQQVEEERLHKKRKAACEGKIVLPNCAVRNERKKADMLKKECRQVSEPADELIGTAQPSKEGIIYLKDSNMSDFVEITDGNYLKLLELNNAADEECYRMAMEMPLSPTLHEIDVEDLEASDANKINHSIEKIICDEVSDKNGDPWDSFNIQGPGGKDLDRSLATGKNWDIQDAGAEVGCAGDNILKFVVGYSDIEDGSSMSRICNTSRTCSAQCSLATRTEWMVREILFALESEGHLLPKEKVCVFFSLLLLNFSVASSSKFGSMHRESNPCLDSFAQHMCSVMSDGEARGVFAKFGCLDEFLGLLEDFLIYGRVFVCKDARSKAMVECDSSNFQLDDIDTTPRPASADEVVAGSIILASLCAAFDRVGFLCETSYNILRIKRFSRSLVLRVLHVFAYLGGEKFFDFSNYDLVTVMKSIVIFLEGGRSEIDSGTHFGPCVKCPFSDEAVPVDTATSLLLERLNVFLGPMSQEVVQSTNSNSNLTLCDLSDLLSLVELVASNMSWAWSTGKVIPQLLKVLESCKAENVIAGIIVLLGQLGRLGVDSFGYEDEGVEFLRHELSCFLCRESVTSTSLPTQIATVTSMLGLMPLDFKAIVQSNTDSAAIASQSELAESIKKWYSLLPKKQQELSFSLVETASERNIELRCS